VKKGKNRMYDFNGKVSQEFEYVIRWRSAQSPQESVSVAFGGSSIADRTIGCGLCLVGMSHKAVRLSNDTTPVKAVI